MENSGKKGFTVLNPGVLTTVQDLPWTPGPCASPTSW